MSAQQTINFIAAHLNGTAALHTAELTTMSKTKGEKDTEFVKRIVATYLYAHAHVEVHGMTAFDILKVLERLR